MYKIKPTPISISKALEKAPRIVGIGPSAWPRAVNGYYFPKFSVLCANNCQDNDLIRAEGIEVYSLKEADPTLDFSPLTPGMIITQRLAKEYLEKIEEPFVFLIYKSAGKFEEYCSKYGWKFLGNKMEVRDKFEDKRVFKEIIRSLGITSIPGDNMPIGKLTPEVFSIYQEKFGQKKIVLQIAEATWGGGSGTFFVENKEDLSNFTSRVSQIEKNLEGKKKRMETVNIAPYISGISASIPCCATKYGTYTGSIQTQLVDVAEVGAKLPNRSGVFSGHDWTYRDYKDAQRQATQIGRVFGDYLYSQGYKGIFGLDLIIDENEFVWPVECNPRETDAFPLITMLQMEKGVVPMQVFHALEHLNLSYEVDFEQTDASFKQKYQASQVLIYNKEDEFMIDRHTLKAGVYSMKEGKLVFVRPGFAVWDLRDESEFLLTEDISKESGNIYDPHERMLRLIRKGAMLNKDGSFRQDAAEIVSVIYTSLGLVSARMGYTEEDGLGVLTSKRIYNAIREETFEKSDVINIIKSTSPGLVRPLEISWRMKITDEPIIFQIKSKRTRKHITADLKRLEKLRITIKVVEDLDDVSFFSWYEFYEKLMKSLPLGKVVIAKSWLKEKKAKGKKVGAILAYKEGKVVGGEVFLVKNSILSMGYGGAERVTGLSGGLTLLLDYFFLEYAQSQGYKEVSLGQDENFYGHTLSCGLIQYKAKIGFTPIPSKKTFWVKTFIKNKGKMMEEIMFFAGEKGIINTLVVVTCNPLIDYSAYLPQDIDNLIVQTPDEFVASYNQAFEEELAKAEEKRVANKKLAV